MQLWWQIYNQFFDDKDLLPFLDSFQHHEHFFFICSLYVQCKVEIRWSIFIIWRMNNTVNNVYSAHGNRYRSSFEVVIHFCLCSLLLFHRYGGEADRKDHQSMHGLCLQRDFSPLTTWLLSSNLHRAAITQRHLSYAFGLLVFPISPCGQSCWPSCQLPCGILGGGAFLPPPPAHRMHTN